MKYKQEIHKYINAHKDEITETLKEIIKIPSVRGEAQAGAPFGKDCAKVLEHIKRLYEENGFATERDDKGGYLLCFNPTESKCVLSQILLKNITVRFSA